MLATAGMIAPNFVRIPGEQFSFDAIPRVIDAHDKLPESMIQIFAWISFVEACSFAALANMNEFDRAPGDFGFDPLKQMPKDAAKQDEMRVKELKNGRLAMVGRFLSVLLCLCVCVFSTRYSNSLSFLQPLAVWLPAQ
jgi:hypothetical protein